MSLPARLVFSSLLLLLAVAAPPAHADNPFGVMLWPAGGEDISLLAARAGGLGVAWYRPPAVFVDGWQPGEPCPTCAALARSGLHLALTVRNGGRDYAPHRPSTPPVDIDAYKRTLASILDAWKADILVVENEENRPWFYAGGTPGIDVSQAYGRELEAACAVAHAHGAACTNGGLSSDAAAAVAWQDYLERGQADLACDFARRAFYTERNPAAGTRLCAYRSVGEVPKEVRAALLHNADRFLAIYQRAPIDAVNFHWYGHDATALAVVADALARATGKPALSNEIGQWRWDAAPANVRPLLRAATAAKLKLAIWYSLDTPNTASLFNQDGSLRQTGQEFAHQMSGRK